MSAVVPVVCYRFHCVRDGSLVVPWWFALVVLWWFLLVVPTWWFLFGGSFSVVPYLVVPSWWFLLWSNLLLPFFDRNPRCVPV